MHLRKEPPQAGLASGRVPAEGLWIHFVDAPGKPTPHRAGSSQSRVAPSATATERRLGGACHVCPVVPTGTLKRMAAHPASSSETPLATSRKCHSHSHLPPRLTSLANPSQQQLPGNPSERLERTGACDCLSLLHPSAQAGPQARLRPWVHLEGWAGSK